MGMVKGQMVQAEVRDSGSKAATEFGIARRGLKVTLAPEAYLTRPSRSKPFRFTWPMGVTPFDWSVFGSVAPLMLVVGIHHRGLPAPGDAGQAGGAGGVRRRVRDSDGITNTDGGESQCGGCPWHDSLLGRWREEHRRATYGGCHLGNG